MFYVYLTSKYPFEKVGFLKKRQQALVGCIIFVKFSRREICREYWIKILSNGSYNEGIYKYHVIHLIIFMPTFKIEGVIDIYPDNKNWIALNNI